MTAFLNEVGFVHSRILLICEHRGTGNTIPFSCTDNEIDADTMLSEFILGNSSDVALGRLWTRGAINADLCFQKSNATGSLIGTAFVARDLISVVDALGEDGMLRYWGKQTLQVSSGTDECARILVWYDIGCNCKLTSHNNVQNNLSKKV
jgi:hypothetical protein